MNEFESYLELPFTVEYSVSGSHMAATERDPAESPELELTSVKLGKTEVMHELEQGALDILSDEAWGHAAEAHNDAADAKADYLYEQRRDEEMGL